MTAPEPADLARQHGAPWARQAIEDELMKMETQDYGKPKPRPRYVDARPLAWLGIVAIAALFVAALVIVGGMW